MTLNKEIIKRLPGVYKYAKRNPELITEEFSAG